MTAVISRRRVPTVALWGALGVLAWVLLVALFGGGAAHASDRDAPHDPPAAASGQNAQHTAEQRSTARTTARTDRWTPSRDRQAARQQERDRRRSHHAAAPAPAHVQAPARKHTEESVRAQAPVKKTAAVHEHVHRLAQTARAPRTEAVADTSSAAAPKQFALRTGTTEQRAEPLVAPVGFISEKETDDAAPTLTSAKLSSFAALVSYTAQYDDDHRTEAYTAEDAVTTISAWTTTSVKNAYKNAYKAAYKNAYKAATHHARHHWGEDGYRAWTDSGRHHGHSHADAPRPGMHRAPPASVVRTAPAAPSTVASSWTRAVTQHHPAATVVAAPSTVPSGTHDPAPSDDTSADAELPGPFTPVAPSTTTSSSASGPLALASAITHDLPIHEGSPVRAAEVTQSAVPAAPVFTTDVSPD